MTTSACGHRPPPPDRPLIGFVVGKYFAMHPDKTPDFNGITRNIEEAVGWAIRLWRSGFLAFTPHLNTHHFEAKTRIDPDPLENEEYYRAFDRKLLSKAIDFVFATPNWRGSTGGRLEVQLANHLGIPVFESIPEVEAWASGNGLYTTVAYNQVSEEARRFGEKKDMRIVVVDGPFWAQDGDDVDFPAIRRHADAAERAAIQLFDNKVAAFTPQLNSSYERLGYRVPEERYHLLNDEMVRRVADGLLLLPGWEGIPPVRERVAIAHELGKPAMTGMSEVLAWQGGNGFAAVSIQKR